MNNEAPGWRPVETAFALGAAFAGLLAIEVLAVATSATDESDVLVLGSVLVATTAAVARLRVAVALAALGWFAVMGSSRPPYVELHFAGLHPLRDAAVLLVVATIAGLMGHGARARASDLGRVRTIEGWTGTLEDVSSPPASPPQRSAPWRLLTRAVSPRRQLLGLALEVTLLPVVTLVLASAGSHLSFVDDILIYLVALVAISMLGGLWPAVLAAIGASLLLNWFFTPPVHRFTIDAPQNLLALVLFVLVAVIVSATVHLSAQRAADADHSSGEAATLLALARTVLGGDDSPSAILNHLSQNLGLPAELLERSGSGVVRIAASRPGTDRAAPTPPRGSATAPPAFDIAAGSRLQLRVHGDVSAISPRILDGYAAQLAAALDRDRLRIQASQAETLAEGNRIRTALLAAVSHDLRTPLASVKASVSTLRQTDITLAEIDRADLLATIEEGADRLDALIGNLLDLSRLQTGSLRPFLRPTSLEEVAPVAMRGLDHGDEVTLLIPEDLALIRTDPGLLDRVLANVLANALRYSPAGRPPSLLARELDGWIRVEIIDHGPGVPAESRDVIFEAFQRLGDQHTASGVGLGLAVAKGFTEAMGGRISAHDSAGGGLTIRLLLPLAGERHPVGTG